MDSNDYSCLCETLSQQLWILLLVYSIKMSPPRLAARAGVFRVRETTWCWRRRWWVVQGSRTAGMRAEVAAEEEGSVQRKRSALSSDAATGDSHTLSRLELPAPQLNPDDSCERCPKRFTPCFPPCRSARGRPLLDHQSSCEIFREHERLQRLRRRVPWAGGGRNGSAATDARVTRQVPRDKAGASAEDNGTRGRAAEAVRLSYVCTYSLLSYVCTYSPLLSEELATTIIIHAQLNKLYPLRVICVAPLLYLHISSQAFMCVSEGLLEHCTPLFLFQLLPIFVLSHPTLSPLVLRLQTCCCPPSLLLASIIIMTIQNVY